MCHETKKLEIMPKREHSNLFQRYIWLAETMASASDGLTFDEIDRIWRHSVHNEYGSPLPKKTFQRHCREIEALLGISIVCNRHNRYRYHIDDNGGLESGGLSSWLLDSFTVSDMLIESRRLSGRILFERIPSGHRFLPAIIGSMHKSSQLQIVYSDFRKGRSKAGIEPYCLKVFKQRWYVVARNADISQIRIYSLDRIESVENTDKTFIFPEDFDGKTYFRDCYGIERNTAKSPEHIVLRAYGDKAAYIRTLPLHSSQKETATTTEFSDFELYVRPTFDFCQELLSHGGDIEVLSPQSLRTIIYDEARLMVRRYAER